MVMMEEMTSIEENNT
jgi:hypothetical protein